MTEEKTIDAKQLAEFLELNGLCKLSRDEHEIVMWYRLLKEAGLGKKARAVFQASVATAAFVSHCTLLTDGKQPNGFELARWALPDLDTNLKGLRLDDDEKKEDELKDEVKEKAKTKLITDKQKGRLRDKTRALCEGYLENKFGISNSYAPFFLRTVCEMPAGNSRKQSRAVKLHLPEGVKRLADTVLISIPAKQIRARKLAEKSAAKKSVEYQKKESTTTTKKVTKPQPATTAKKVTKPQPATTAKKVATPQIKSPVPSDDFEL